MFTRRQRNHYLVCTALVFVAGVAPLTALSWWINLPWWDTMILGGLWMQASIIIGLQIEKRRIG